MSSPAPHDSVDSVSGGGGDGGSSEAKDATKDDITASPSPSPSPPPPPTLDKNGDATSSSTLSACTITFTGTGTSSGVPIVSCLSKGGACDVCTSARFHPSSRNRRRNTGLILKFKQGDVEKVIAIDIGKFWYHSAIEHFPILGIKHIDAVILTHGHFDAIGGLDDLRDFTFSRDSPLPVYCDQATFECVASAFPYIASPDKATGSGFVPQVNFHPVLKPGEPLEIEGLNVVPFDVWHGPRYTCLAFRFGNVAYMSDVSTIKPESRKYLRGTEIVIVDSLWSSPSVHRSHFGVEQALKEISEGFGVDMKPHTALLTGMNHSFDHDMSNAVLKERGFHNVAFAYDGLTLSFTPSLTIPADTSDEGVTCPVSLEYVSEFCVAPMTKPLPTEYAWRRAKF